MFFWFTVVMLLLVSGCTTQTQQQPPAPTTSTAPASTSANITIKDFAFSPGLVTVKAGATVTWTNEDSAPHSIRPDSSAAGMFDNSGTLSTGGSYSFVFANPGTYEYSCGIHPPMKGKVVVE
jgi:amicyanin